MSDRILVHLTPLPRGSIPEQPPTPRLRRAKGVWERGGRGISEHASRISNLHDHEHEHEHELAPASPSFVGHEEGRSTHFAVLVPKTRLGENLPANPAL